MVPAPLFSNQINLARSANVNYSDMYYKTVHGSPGSRRRDDSSFLSQLSQVLAGAKMSTRRNLRPARFEEIGVLGHVLGRC
jgi:hypothetical protein